MTTQTTDSAAGGAVNTPDSGLPPLSIGTPSAEGERSAANEEATPSSDADQAKKGQDGAPDADDTGEVDGPGKKPNRVPFQERIRQITARRQLAERERDRAIDRATRAERRIQQLEHANGQDLPYDQREDLRIERTQTRQEVRRAREDVRYAEEDAQAAMDEVRIERNLDFMDRLRAADKTNPGLYERAETTPVTEAMADFIGESDLSVEMMDFLSNKEHSKELQQLVDLTSPRGRRGPDPDNVARAHRIMARIEARISAAPAARKTTNAPDPGRTLNGGSPPNKGKSLEEMGGKDRMGEFAPALLQKLGLVRKS